MRYLRKRTGSGRAADIPQTREPGIDLVRFERLIQTSIRLRDSGVDHETIQRRASAEDLSWNEALEAIDRELLHG